MKSIPLPSLLLAAALALPLAAGGAAEATTTSTAKFSDPARPGTLKVQVARGDIRITGTDTQEVSVRSTAQPATSGQRKDGLRVLSSSTGFTLTEKGNVITLESATDGHGARANFDVTVPRETSVVVENSWGGSVQVARVTGDIEISGMNGEVRLEDIGGGAVVQTMNGEIRASVAQLTENRPLSFTSMNGEVQLRLPTTAKANVRLRTHNGSILTDFDESALATKVESTGRKLHIVKPPRPSSGSKAVLPPEAHEAIRDASRVAAEVSREVAQALREAARAAREGLQEGETSVPHVPRAPAPPIPPVTGGKLVTGTLNGGGPEINVATMNGDVTLRKVEAQK